MKSNSRIVLIGIFCLFIWMAFRGLKEEHVKFLIPKGWPKPNYDFSKNKVTTAGFNLGRKLFYDPILSKDSSISCASCHLQATGFAHVDHDLSHGIEGKIGTRNAPGIVNAAWNKFFMWDGGVNHLEMQALAPITNPIEMNESLDHLVHKLSAQLSYRQAFKNAFGDSNITGQRVLLGITQFVVMLNSSNSKYDKYMRHEKGGEFTEQEFKGLNVFRKHCAACHTEPLFTNNGFANNGLAIDTDLKDYGRYQITHQDSDSLSFKVPSLRNVEFTYPYMHDGRFKKLSEVINHYNSGIVPSKTLAKELQNAMQLSPEQKTDLLVFLLTLSDKSFLFDPRFSYPKEKK